MNQEKIDRQAYKVNLGQGRMIIRLLAAMDDVLEGGQYDATAAKILLDLSRAMSNVGGKPA